ncbi:hypothetical protein AGLY_001815 [Aphis glycines]|uniref:Uncharacterized protein n=1 Tax=Aphis glycines TaxID=307491 RepID=A0A6G0U7C6_APHGL|nr:hypothetical protein AGLY_001815 [Aphis glycines]
MSKLRKFAILNIWYKVLHKFFFKYLYKISTGFRQKNVISYKSVDKIFLALSKYLKIVYKVPHISNFDKIKNICKLFCSSKFIKLFIFISNTDESSPFRIVFHQKKEFSNSFQKNRVKQNKSDGKMGIFTRNQFLSKSIFYMVLKKNQKSLVTFFFISVYSSNFYEICQNHKNLQIKKFNTYSFPSNSNRENSKRYYRKNVISSRILNFYEIASDNDFKHLKYSFLFIKTLENLIQDFPYVWPIIIIKELKSWCIQTIKK